jgi:hypothetical protein
MPAALADLMESCFEDNPADRPSSGERLARELSARMREEPVFMGSSLETLPLPQPVLPVQARKTSPAEPARHSAPALPPAAARKAPVFLWVMAGIFLLVALSAVVGAGVWFESWKEEARILELRKRTATPPQSVKPAFVKMTLAIYQPGGNESALSEVDMLHVERPFKGPETRELRIVRRGGDLSDMRLTIRDEPKKGITAHGGVFLKGDTTAIVNLEISPNAQAGDTVLQFEGEDGTSKANKRLTVRISDPFSKGKGF